MESGMATSMRRKCTCYRSVVEKRDTCIDDGNCAAVHNMKFVQRKDLGLGPWKRLADHQPDPKLGTVLYRLKKPGRGDRWFVGLAYFTVSNRWGIDASGEPWGMQRGEDVQWMEIPR